MALVYQAKSSKTLKSILPQKKIELAPSTAQLMMMASGTKTKLHISKWHTLVPVLFAGNHFLPVPSFYHLSNYLPHFSWLTQTSEGTFAVSEQSPLAGQTCHEFESAAIDILSFILALTNMPGSPDKSIADKYQEMRNTWLEQESNKWFNLTHKTGISLEPKELYTPYEGQNRCFLPSSKRTKDAFLVTTSTPSGQNAHPLHSGTRAHLDKLTEKGELFSMVCGGSAPVDFIFVMLKTSRVKGTDPCEVELRLADAKHTTTGDVAKVKEMLERFHLVSEYLRVALKKECNMTVTGEQFAIVTNKMDADQSMLTVCGSDGNLKDTVDKTHVLSPTTFDFPPFTTRLFD